MWERKSALTMVPSGVSGQQAATGNAVSHASSSRLSDGERNKGRFDSGFAGGLALHVPREEFESLTGYFVQPKQNLQRCR